MPGPNASRKRKGGRGPCSYCGKVHKKGKRRGDSCKGHGMMHKKNKESNN